MEECALRDAAPRLSEHTKRRVSGMPCGALASCADFIVRASRLVRLFAEQRANNAEGSQEARAHKRSQRSKRTLERSLSHELILLCHQIYSIQSRGHQRGTQIAAAQWRLLLLRCERAEASSLRRRAQTPVDSKRQKWTAFARERSIGLERSGLN